MAITSIMYKTKIKSDVCNYYSKIYYGTSKGLFKQHYENHKKLFNHKKHSQIQSFRRNTGDLKNSNHDLKYNFIFQKYTDQEKEQSFVIYFLNEKRFIIKPQENNLLNQGNELISSVETKTNLSL